MHRELHGFVRLFLVVSILGLLILGSVPASAQDWAGRARVQGTVTDENGDPIEGATVRLIRTGRDVGPDPIKTNAKGRWGYLGLAGGPWTVEIEYPGYAISEGTFPVSAAQANEPIRVQLQPASAAAAAAADDPAVAAAAAAAEAITKKWTEARSLMQGEKPQEARALLMEILPELEEPDKQSALYYDVARTHFAEDDTDAAIAALEKGLAAHPDHVESLQLISTLLINEGRGDEAEVYRVKLPEGKGVDPNALLNVGIEHYNSNDLDAALASFDDVVSGDPTLADAYYYRGLVHLNKGNNDLAIADFQKLLELAPDHPSAGEAQQFLDYLQSQ